MNDAQKATLNKAIDAITIARKMVEVCRIALQQESNLPNASITMQDGEEFLYDAEESLDDATASINAAITGNATDAEL